MGRLQLPVIQYLTRWFQVDFVDIVSDTGPVGVLAPIPILKEPVPAIGGLFVGDEGNDQVEVDGYGLLNLRMSYQATDRVVLFLHVDNLLDTEYETFGVLAEIEIVELDEAPGAADPRFVSPGASRSAFAGVRFRF